MYASVARFCVQHRRWVLAAWMVFFVAGIVIGGEVFSRLTDSGGGSGSESAQGSAIMTRAASMGKTAVVLIQGPPVAAPATRAHVRALTARIERLPDVTMAVNAYTSRDPALRGSGGHASLIVVSIRKDAGMMNQAMAVDAMRSAARGAVPGARVQVGGDLGVMRDGMAGSQNDLIRGELISFPILLIALFFIFGGLRAALLPIFAAFAVTAGALTLLMGMTHVTHIASYAVDVITLFGLALAVDYSLLMVNRFREARAAGSGTGSAVEHTLRTAGRTVTFSALTVAASLAGLLAIGDPTFTSVAIGGIATVLVALAAALTLIPRCWRRGPPSSRPPSRGPPKTATSASSPAGCSATPGSPEPGSPRSLAAAVLPFLHASYGIGDPRTLPASSQGRHVAATMLADFPALRADPVIVVAQLPATDPRIASYPPMLKRQPKQVALTALLRMPEQAPGYIFGAFVFTYGTTILGASRNFLLIAVLASAVLSFLWVTCAGHLSDRVGRKRMYIIGCVFVAVFGFVYFAMLDTRVPALIFIAIAVSGLPIMTMYGPEAALIAESFSPRLRYSGSSLGYQLASIIAGGPSPFIATALLAAFHTSQPIALYILACAVIGITATSLLTDYTGKDISAEYHGV